MLEKKYFLGEEVSIYGLENKRVDYYTLSKTFEHVLCNNITNLFYSVVDGELLEPETVNGSDTSYYENIETGFDIPEYEYEDLEEEDQEKYEYRDAPEIYQYYIISESGANILKEYTTEIVYYIESLDLYIWGVTHWGTSWDYVLTEIEL